MTRESIKTGATVEAARTAAMLELGLTDEDDFHMEVLKLPTKKVLGLFGGSPAEVKITVETPDETPKKARKEKKENKPEKNEKAEKPQKAKEKQQPKKAAPKAEKPAKEAEPAQSFAERRASLTPSDGHQKTAEYIISIVKALGIEECEVKAYDGENEVLFELSCGEDYGIVIGRRGETLDAIQYLARMVENKGIQGYKRVSINVGNYREKREAALQALAKKDAARVLRTGRSLTLEPMNPYERRIIHTAIQEIEGVTSYSTGVDLDRRVIIASENAPKNAHGDRRDNRRGRGGRGDRPRREPYVPDIAADREKKNDVAGVSLYGKIEVKKDAAEEASDTTEA